MAARSRVVEREHHGRAWLAWHVAALPRLKKFPTLESLLGMKRQVRRQSADELAANIKRMFGIKPREGWPK